MDFYKKALLEILTVIFLTVITAYAILDQPTGAKLGYYTIIGRALLLVVFLAFIYFVHFKKLGFHTIKKLFAYLFVFIMFIGCIFNVLMFSSYGKEEQSSYGITNQSELRYIDTSWYSIKNTKKELDARVKFLLQGESFEYSSRERLESKEEGFTIKINDFIVNLWILAIGFIWLAILLKENLGNFVLAAYPLGSIVSMIYFCILGFLKIKITSTTIFVMFTILSIAVWCIRLWRSKKISVANIINSSVIGKVIISILILAFFSFVPAFFISNDSYGNIRVAQQIAQTGFFTDAVTQITRGFLYSAMSSFTFFKSGFFNYSFQPVITLLTILFSVHWFLKDFEDTRYKAVVIISSIAGFLVPMICYHSIWLLNNLSVGLLLLLFNIFLKEYLDTDKRSHLILSFLFFTAATMIRMEGLIFGTIILVTLLSNKLFSENSKLLLKFGAGTWIIGVIWFLGMYYISNGQYDKSFWTPAKGLAQLVLLTGFLIYLIICQSVKIKYLWKNENNLMVIFFLFMIFITGLLKFGDAVINFKAITESVFLFGYWNLFWYCSIIIFVGLFITGLLPEESKYVFRMCICYLLGVYVFSIFRDHAYHNGVSDSALRMILHIMPTFVFCWLLTWKNLFAKHLLEEGNQKASSQKI